LGGRNGSVYWCRPRKPGKGEKDSVVKKGRADRKSTERSKGGEAAMGHLKSGNPKHLKNEGENNKRSG